MRELSAKDYMEVVGLSAIVASLVFVGLQLQQEHRVALAQITTEVDSTVIELSQAIRANPEVWRNGLDGNELSDNDELTFISLARAVETAFRGRFQRLGQLRIGDPQNVADSFAYQLYMYPGLRRAFEHFESVSDHVDKAFNRPDRIAFRNAVSDALEELDSTSPAVPDKDYLPML